jgi:hypothetical protein
MRLKLISAMVLSAAVLTMVSLAPSRGWAQDSQSDATASVKINPSTGVAAITVAPAIACPNIACASGDTCKFETFLGTSQSFTRFGAGLSKATLAACVVINETNAVTIGSGVSGNTECSPSTGTVILTSSAKKNPSVVTLAFAGQVCTVATSATKQILNGIYVLTASTDSKIASASGNLAVSYDTATNPGPGDASFSGTRD